MKIIETYRTKDGKLHQSSKSAESHALANAQNIIQNAMFEIMPQIENSYFISQHLILYFIENPQKFEDLYTWLEDAKNENL